MDYDTNKKYLDELAKTIRQEIALFQRAGGILKLYQRAIVVRCDNHDKIPVIIDDAFSIITEAAPMWNVKKLGDYRAREYPRTLQNGLDFDLVSAAAIETGFFSAPWYTGMSMFRKKYFSNRNNAKAFEEAIVSKRGDALYSSLIAKISQNLLRELPASIVVDGRFIDNDLMNDVIRFVMSNEISRIGAVLWIILACGNVSKITDLTKNEKIPVKTV